MEGGGWLPREVKCGVPPPDPTLSPKLTFIPVPSEEFEIDFFFLVDF